MTSKTKSTANRQNARKSTGPKTQAGLEVSSMNALTHGARSRSLISEAEQVKYENFLAELKREYKTEHPLVRMQLERIARATVYVDRIQNAIDATYLLAQQQEVTDEGLAMLLDMDHSQRLIAKKIISGELTINGFVDHDRLKIAAEASNFDINKFNNQSDFLESTPLLCEYLFSESQTLGKSIEDVITKDARPVSGNDILKEAVRIIERNRQASVKNRYPDKESSPPLPPESLEDAISKTKLTSLKEFAKRMKAEFERIASTHYKVIAFNELRKIDPLPSELDLDRLDRLQRYQTSAQRQLSSFIGELLQLVK